VLKVESELTNLPTALMEPLHSAALRVESELTNLPFLSTAPSPFWESPPLATGLSYSLEWETDLHQQEEKAARADDASIPYHMWDGRVWKLNLHSGVSRKWFQNHFGNFAF